MGGYDDADREKPFISTRDVGMSFGDATTLDSVSFSIQRGEFTSIIGPSGCGKSTLLRLIAGLMEPTSGSLRVNGMRPEIARRLHLNIAFVFQDPTLLPWRTVAENILLPLELNGTPRDVRRRRLEEALALIGLNEDDVHKRPRKLSGGMRMRVSLARALVTQPDVLLLDEPFAALDDVLRQQLNEDLFRLWRQQHWTGIFVTHNVAEAVFLSQRVLVMSPRPGRLVDDVRVDLPDDRTPTLRGSTEFAIASADVWRRFREAAR